MKTWVHAKGWFIFAALLLLPFASWAAVPVQNPLTQWTLTHPRGLRISVGPVAYGNGNYVLGNASDFGRPEMLVSSNTVQWQAANPGGGGEHFSDIIFAEGRFWSVGHPGIFSSSDAIKWEQHYTAYFIHRLRYHNGTWLAGEIREEWGSRMLISNNGSNWTELEWAFAPDIEYFEGMGGIWVAIDASYQRTYLSRDARNWSPTSGLGEFRELRGLVASDQLFLAYGAGASYETTAIRQWPQFAFSRDGVDWTSVRVPGFPDDEQWSVGAVAWGHAGFVALAQGWGTREIAVLTSTDGVTWEKHDFPVYTGLSRVSYGGGLYFLSGQQGALFTSPDGIHWTQRLGSSSRQIRTLTAGNYGLVAVGDAGLLLTSDDGRFWHRHDSVTHEDLWDVGFSGGRYVAVGGSSRPVILVSPTAERWQRYTASSGGPLRSVTADYNQVLAVGLDGTVARLRKNRAEFFQVPGEPDFRSVAKLGDTFIAVAHQTGYGELHNPGTIYTSTNGVDWTPVLAHEKALTSVATGNERAVVLGLNVAYVSGDALHWQKVTYSNDWSRLQVTYGSGLFLASSRGMQVYASRDGVRWKAYPLITRAMPDDPWYYEAVFPDTPWVAHANNRFYTGRSAEYMWRGARITSP